MSNQTMNTQTTDESWKRVAGVRQGIIAKLEKKLARLEAENEQLRKDLS